jgi:hypothetical protein
MAKTQKPYPLMAQQCKTCPFRAGADARLQDQITSRLLETNQMCHAPRLVGKRETHLCRGGRDWQLQVFYRLGLLEEENDAAWAAAQARGREQARGGR